MISIAGVRQLLSDWCDESFLVWLRMPHWRLDGQSPEQVIAAGGMDQVIALIEWEQGP